jgi:hypothetical protein
MWKAFFFVGYTIGSGFFEPLAQYNFPMKGLRSERRRCILQVRLHPNQSEAFFALPTLSH